MALKNGAKLINYWAEKEQVDEYQKICKEMGFYSSRMLWVIITMFIEGYVDREEAKRRYIERSKQLRERRIKRLEDARSN